MVETLRKAFQEYKDIQKAYTLALSTMYYDIATIAPKKGSAKRNEAMAYLSGEAFSKATDKEALAMIEELGKITNDTEEKREITLFLKGMEYDRVLPKDVYVAMQKSINDSEAAWHIAKDQDDYASFAPYLKDVILKQKEALTYVQKESTDYDYLLDRYEDGMNVKQYDAFFNSIKEQLVPFIKKINEQKEQIDDSVLHQSFDIDQQAKYNAQLLDYLGIDREKCIMGLTEHPFTDFFSENEARITTHYYEHDVMSGIFSTMHEYGHALYSLQVKPEYDGTALKDNIGYAMHESQSRFMENHIGRHPAFWQVQYPILQSYFPKQLSHVSFEDFMRMINITRPSFIRTEADELTYPLHILIRYELEKEIFNGSIPLDQLETMWNDKYEKYLGLRPRNHREGILQDMHWGGGNFGYFPTYALGSAYAAQFYSSMEKQLPVADYLRNNQFDKIAAWLKDNIHYVGAYQNANEVLKQATGDTFRAQYYIDYLMNKYRTLYQL